MFIRHLVGATHTLSQMLQIDPCLTLERILSYKDHYTERKLRHVGTLVQGHTARKGETLGMLAETCWLQSMTLMLQLRDVVCGMRSHRMTYIAVPTGYQTLVRLTDIKEK